MIYWGMLRDNMLNSEVGDLPGGHLLHMGGDCRSERISHIGGVFCVPVGAGWIAGWSGGSDWIKIQREHRHSKIHV